MKTTFQFTEPATELKNFTPIEGTWEVVAEEAEWRDELEIIVEIESAIEEQFDFPVEVLLFTSSGNKINSECPWDGNFLATRK